MTDPISLVGTSLKHYRIVEKIGEGGMGIAYRAIDSHLDRTVTIKVLRPEAVGDAERKWRFVREAKAASALNHPHIVTIHDIDSDQGVDFIVMEYVEGSTLDKRIPKGGLPLAEALDYAAQIASALGAAHAAGIIHRDVKPANVIIGPGARVKVLDFGLAKLMEPGAPGGELTSDSTATAATAYERTRQGAILGTIAYMSPEQAEGRPVDARSDVFSLGSVVYEMLAGRRPFEGNSHLLTLTAILRDAPPPLKVIRADVPASVEAIVRRALEKQPEDRFASAKEMEMAFNAAGERAGLRAAGSSSSNRAGLARSRGPWRAAAVILLVALPAGAYWLVKSSRARRAREVTIPQITKLVSQQEYGAALRLAKEAERDAPAEVARMRNDSWQRSILKTEPEGAQVFLKQYLDVRGEWLPLGKSPVDVRIPLAYYRWKIEKEGFAPVEIAAPTRLDPVHLDPISTVPTDMVRIPGGRYALRSLPQVTLDDSWIDKYEVTNRQFKAFVDAGGYAKREFWKQPFLRDGVELSWEEAQAKFRDATGRPGPASWELGSYPEGHEDYPVNGVSWFEAAAYAEFAGKSLPTIYHWYKAAGITNFSEILKLSNFGGKGPAKVGTFLGLSPDGAYDMAGSVKEWCWNENAGRRYILGGAWTDPDYTFLEPDAQDPFLRAPSYGFRCARYMSPLTDATLTKPVGTLSRDYNKETPVSDEVFKVYRSFYAYDPSPLDAKVEGSDDTSPYWRKEKVSYRDATGAERIPAFLFLPKNGQPPYQTVVFFPSSVARNNRSSADLDLRFLDFVIRSGRAVLFPIYKGTYERRTDPPWPGPRVWRDLVIQWSKDLGRSVDYLESRPDIDRNKLAYYGLSLGAIDGVVLTAIETRFKAAVFLTGGFRFDRYPPEVEPINFVTRVKIPVLFISGRHDFAHPYETAQLPMFRLLGTPEKDKRHYVFEGGHIPPKIQPIIKEILDWLDQYLGPVQPS